MTTQRIDNTDYAELLREAWNKVGIVADSTAYVNHYFLMIELEQEERDD